VPCHLLPSANGLFTWACYSLVGAACAVCLVPSLCHIPEHELSSHAREDSITCIAHLSGGANGVLSRALIGRTHAGSYTNSPLHMSQKQKADATSLDCGLCKLGGDEHQLERCFEYDLQAEDTMHVIEERSIFCFKRRRATGSYVHAASGEPYGFVTSHCRASLL
jgi:hypothetical protein